MNQIIQNLTATSSAVADEVVRLQTPRHSRKVQPGENRFNRMLEWLLESYLDLKRTKKIQEQLVPLGEGKHYAG